MSVTKPSTSAATSRLQSAIATATAPETSADRDAAPEQPVVKRSPRTSSSSSTPTRDAARGANAGPDGNGGATAAEQGASEVMGAGQPGTTPSHAPTPYEASMASYESAGAAAGGEPDHAAAYDAAMAAAGDAPAPMDAASTSAGGEVQGTGAWNENWQVRFEKLQLAPADIEYLAQSGYSDDELFEIAIALDQVDPLDPNTGASPVEGVDAGSVASADGPTAADAVAMDPAAPGATAWNEEWSGKFTDLMERMGMSESEIREQISMVDSEPIAQEQLEAAYAQMEQSLGAYDDGWESKFTKIMEDLDTPADEQAQVLQQLASGGLSESQLGEAYAQMQNSMPAWDDEWKNKFRSLDAPDDLLKQLEESGAPKDALQQQFDMMLETKMEYKNDGRLEKLEDAGASGEEKWGIMLQGTKGEEFDKVVEQIRSSNVPAWKRIGSFALNLIPGVYALQFVTGKDWLTGDKIDRTNPLNIVGAVASGFAGFTAVRSAIAGVQGLSAANAAAQATKAAAGGAALTDAVTATSALSQGSFKAMQAANLVDKFDKGLKFTDYLKSAVPLVNRFGEAGRLSSFGRGYSQAMQLTAGMAAAKTVADGSVTVDKATKATVLSELRQGRSVQDALAAAGRTSGSGGGYAIRAQDVVRDATRYGFLQGGAGKLAEGNKVVRGSGNFNFNPFRSTATIAETATEGVFSLGRGVNFGSRAGLAQGIGAVRGANSVANAGLAVQATSRAAAANPLLQDAGKVERMAGVRIAGAGQRVATIEATADWGRRLGVTDGGAFRSLGQLTGSGRSVRNATGILEHGGSAGYRAARGAGVLGQKYATYAAVPLIGGSAIGMTGAQVQPAWQAFKDREEIQAEQEVRSANAEQEAADLERLYAERQAELQGQGAQAPAGAAQPTPGVDAGSAMGGGAQVVGVSPTTGGQLVHDPSIGMVVDVTNGDVYDPQTGQVVGNLAQQQAQAQPAPAATGDQSVYMDPNTGYYVDSATGLMADPATGMVYDQQGNVVANVNQPAA